MTIIGKCPRCKHHSLMEVKTSNVVGVIQCTKGNKSVVNKIQSGEKCPLCGYSYIETSLIDSKGHRVA